jgi:tryptophan-rich sensory protein
MRKNGVDFIALAVSIVLVAGAASFGALFSPGDWYAGLVKPSFNPPNWIFGPVWTALYFMMAVAAWLVWRRRDAQPVTLALAVYLVQLALNALWSWLFFGLHAMGAAFIDICLLWLLILATLVLFWRVHRWAGALLAPYLAWVGFAAVLNFALWQLNAG